MRYLIYVLIVAATVGCTGSGDPFFADVAAIRITTANVPVAGAGEFYNMLIICETSGGAAVPDRFALSAGSLPPGMYLVADRVDRDNDGLPDPDGDFTGHCRLMGHPRKPGSYKFTIQAVSTGAIAGDPEQPDLSAVQDYVLNVGQGTITILTPTAEEGTVDPGAPAFPTVINFVNPENPQAFFSFAFLVAGGSEDNLMNVFMPRELELSTFDTAVVNGQALLTEDLDETDGSGDKYRNHFTDGGLFMQPAGVDKVQVGGFQSPRGEVGDITNLFPEWFQHAPGPVPGQPGKFGPEQNSRRSVSDPEGFAGGDPTLVPGKIVKFSDYFDSLDAAGNPIPGETDDYVTPGPDTIPPPTATGRTKYPFTSDQYFDAFFAEAGAFLRYRIIVEAIDRGNSVDKNDDLIARKSYVMQVRIPPILIDTVVLPQGQAGVVYVASVNMSGGVPPLKVDLEWIDGDAASPAPTDPHDLDKELFGLNAEESTGLIMGIPRAAGDVKLTVRVFADFMSSAQKPSNDTDPPVPVGGADNEWDGWLELGGVKKAGRHKTIITNFLQPVPGSVVNTSLPGGIDGMSFNPPDGVTLRSADGVAMLTPYPPDVDLTGDNTYNMAAAIGNVEWSATYVVDSSHPKDTNPKDGTPDADALININGTLARPTGEAANGEPWHPGDDTVAGVPLSLILEGGPAAVDTSVNGRFHGVATDRGFHALTFTGTDFYVGLAGSTDTQMFRGSFSTELTLSVSPDAVIYARGDPVDGEPSGLVDATKQKGENRMVPLAGGYTLYEDDAGQSQKLFDKLPAAFDILPVMLVHGGDDEHIDKHGPSISGFWPPESNRDYYWSYSSPRQEQHCQQLFTWVQLPSQRRVYLFGETEVKQWNESVSSGGHSQRYQQFDEDGDRGVLVVDPRTGESWVPAILDNAGGGSDTDGSQFGAEVVLQRNDSAYYYYWGIGYWKRYYYGSTQAAFSTWDREALGQGLGAYIQGYSYNYSYGRYRVPPGRTAVSVAASADGVWMATALPGGNAGRFLLWRTDKQPIPPGILAQTGYVTAVDGIDSDGSELTASACIVTVGGQATNGGSGPTILTDQKHLLPDALCFVNEGLLFLVQGQLNYVFGFSLVDGHLSSVSLPGVDKDKGFYFPDQDYLRGDIAPMAFSAQFAFAGDRPGPGEEGPDTVAFIAGDNAAWGEFNDLPQPRDGYYQRGNRTKDLFVLELSSTAGLDLDASELINLTSGSSALRGDLLPPGRIGEQLDYLALSDDGKYVAVVRDYDTNSYTLSSFYGTFEMTFSSWSQYNTGRGYPNDDVMLFTTDPTEDLDPDNGAGTGGRQSVYYLGTHSFTSNGTNPGGMPTWATGKNLFNGRFRRINGVNFTPLKDPADAGATDELSLIVNYAGSNRYNPKYYYTYAVNPVSTYYGYAAQMQARIRFLDANGKNIGSNSLNGNAKNMLAGLSGVNSIGPTSAPFGDISPSDQLFWSTFKSENGRFLYFVSDQLSGSNYMVGINIYPRKIGDRDPFKPFMVHSSSVGFEQIDENSFNYESRFFSVPGGVVNAATGRDGAGIVCFIASDASAGPTSRTDLEVYAFDGNVGGAAVALSSAVTTGSANAINQLYLSTDGNVLAFQRCRTTSYSRDDRTTLQKNNEICVVLNVHDALDGATPDAFVLSEAASHGHSVAFVGEATKLGPQTLLYSVASSGSNWDERILRSVRLEPGAIPTTIDSIKSFYEIFAGGRKLNDDPATSN